MKAWWAFESIATCENRVLIYGRFETRGGGVISLASLSNLPPPFICPGSGEGIDPPNLLHAIWTT